MTDADATNEDTLITIDVLANDSDVDISDNPLFISSVTQPLDTSDSLTITGVTQPTLGSVSINAGNQLVFDPNGEYDYLDAGESATVTFDYTISDGNGGTDTTTVTVTGNDDALVAICR